MKKTLTKVFVTAPVNGTRRTASLWVVTDALTGKRLTKPMTRDSALQEELRLRANVKMNHQGGK